MVHPKTLELYRDAGFEYRLTTEDFVKERFEQMTASTKEPTRYAIHQMYRVRQGPRDYVVYDQMIMKSDMPGNIRTHYETVGTHPEPTFTYRYDQETGKTAAAAIAGTKTVYDIPATRENMQQILDKDTEETETNFTIQDGPMKYAGFTREEFVSKHFNDLLTKATTGQYPDSPTPFGQEEVRAKQTALQEEEDDKNDKAGERRRIPGGGKPYMKQIKKDLVAETEEGSEEEKEYEKLGKKLDSMTPDGGTELRALRALDSSKDNEQEEQTREPKEEEEDRQREGDRPATTSERKTSFGKKTTGQTTTRRR